VIRYPNLYTSLVSCIILFFSATQFTFANKIEKGYEALVIFDYFQAKKLFQKSLKKDSSPAAYGLALLYFRKDNPFHSLDSAYKYIGIAKSTREKVKLKTRIKLEKYHYSEESILDLEQSISKGFFMICISDNSVSCFDLFIEKHAQSNLHLKAVFKRDSLAFEITKKENQSTATTTFINKYPVSAFKQEALNLFFKQQYFEYTQKETLISYLQFLNDCKESPYKNEAENKVYELSTASNSIKSLENFIKEQSLNHNIPDAWRRLYKIFMSDYGENKYQDFIKKYPDYPFGNEIKNEEILSKLTLLPVKIENAWGYMNKEGKLIIPATYDEAGYFSEDLAVVKKDQKYGYISKANKFMIDPKFDDAADFNQGRAVVELNDHVGLIDRNGFFVFDPIYSEIGPISEGKIFIKKDSLYGYYSKNRIALIPERFQEVESFENNIARVKIENNQAIIDSVGSFVVRPFYKSIDFFNDTLLIYADSNKFGICNLDGISVLPATFDYIGKLSNNRALLVRENKIGYLNDSLQIIIQPTFETYPNYQTYSNFKNGLAKVKKNGKIGLIDLKGKTFVPFNYIELGGISNYISFNKNGKWGYFDEMGKEVIKSNYEYAESFAKGIGIVTKDSLTGIIDIKEKFIIPNAYSTIEWIEGTDFLKVGAGNIYGIFDTNGQTIVPIHYQTISMLSSDLIVLTSGDKIDYLFIKERKLVQLKN
jgi:hypothetical protein